MGATEAYVFDAHLVGFDGVRRKLALRGDQTLLDLHHALFAAFGWWEDHLFAFWLSGEFWGGGASKYSHPFAIVNDVTAPFADGPQAKSAAIRLDALRLSVGQRIAYVFDFGDEWRVELRLTELQAADGDAYPRLVETRGEAPPQYLELEEDVA